MSNKLQERLFLTLLIGPTSCIGSGCGCLSRSLRIFVFLFPT